MTKHRVKVQFNDPPEAYWAEVIYHILGPFTEKMKTETNGFIQELGSEIVSKPGEKTANIFLTMSISMKPG
jgi:hypothetical protein